MECYDVLRSEEDSREDDDQAEADHDRVSVAEAFGNDTVQEEPNNFTHVCAIGQTSLPGSRDLVATIRKLLAVFSIELRKGI